MNKSICSWVLQSFIPLVVIFMVLSAVLIWAQLSIDGKENTFVIINVNKSSPEKVIDENINKNINLLIPKMLNGSEISSFNSLSLMRREKFITFFNRKLVNEPNNLHYLNSLLVLYINTNNKKYIGIRKDILVETKGLVSHQTDLNPELKNTLLNNIALSFFKEEKYIEAKNFYRVLNFNTKSWDSYFALSEIFLRLDNLKKGEFYFEKSIKFSPKDKTSLLYYSFASVLNEIKNYNKSIEYYHMSLKENSGFLKAQIGLARALGKIDHWNKSESLYNKIIIEQPRSAGAHYYYALLLDKLDRYQDAMKELKISILIDGGKMNAQRKLASIYYNLKMYGDALREYKKLSRRSKGNFIYSYHIGKSYFKMGELSKAMKYFHIAIEKKGGHYPDAWIKIGEIYQEKNKLKKAKQSYIDAIKLNPSFSYGYYKLSDLYLLKGQIQLAIIELKKAIRLRPKSKKYRKRLADLYININKKKLALVELRKVYKIDPQSINNHIKLAELLSKLKYRKEAVFHFKEVIKSNPNKRIVWYNLGRNQYFLEKYNEAIKSLGRSLKLIDSGNIELRVKILRYIGISYRSRGDLKLAVSVLKSALEMKGNYHKGRFELAKTYYEMGFNKLAKDQLSVALRFGKKTCKILKSALKWKFRNFEDNWNKECYALKDK